MKVLKRDRDAAKLVQVSAYMIARAREVRELAESDHPLAAQAREACVAVRAGTLELKEAYRLVQSARGDDEDKLLSAQIPAHLVDELRSHARARGQLFRDVVRDAVEGYLIIVADEEADA